MNDDRNEAQAKRELEEKKYQLEIDRWTHQKQWREKEFQHEKDRLKQAKRDTWVRGVVSGLLGTLIAVSIPATVSYYTKIAEDQKTIRAEDQRKQETLIQLINSRESADSSLRAQMFNALLQNYFQERDFRTQIAILEIIGLNFRDSLHTKPMFERLHEDIEENAGKDSQKLIGVLRKAAQRIIKDQLQQIKQSTEGDVCEIEFAPDPLPGDSRSPACFQDLAIRLIDVEADQIIVQTNSKNGSLIKKTDKSLGDKFGVSFYDMPMIDYTSVVSQGAVWKYSIVLKDIDEEDGVVTIAIANLPEDTFGTGDEYKFDEMLKEYLTE